MVRLLTILAGLCSLLYAEEVALSGTVKDNADNPLEGVTVTLAKVDDLSMVTKADGAFSLSNVTGILRPANQKTSFSLTLKNNVIVFTSPTGSLSGTVTIYSSEGRLISTVNLNNIQTEQKHVALPELSSGMYLLAGEVCGESFTQSLVCMGNDLYLKNKTMETENNGLLTLRKSTAVVDTLIASKDGYDTTRYTLTGYSADDIEIVMAEEGGGEFTITSTAFSDCSKMPDEYTCEGKVLGEGIAPPLQWENPPEGTKSYALFFKDMTLVEQNNSMGYHWGMWNIPITITEMPEGLGDQASPAEMGGAQQQGATGTKFFGPCPDWQKTGTTDTYAFVLYAFDTETLSLSFTPSASNLQQLDKFFEDNAIAKTSISVWSDAAPN